MEMEITRTCVRCSESFTYTRWSGGRPRDYCPECGLARRRTGRSGGCNRVPLEERTPLCPRGHVRDAVSERADGRLMLDCRECRNERQRQRLRERGEPIRHCLDCGTRVQRTEPGKGTFPKRCDTCRRNHRLAQQREYARAYQATQKEKIAARRRTPAYKAKKRERDRRRDNFPRHERQRLHGRNTAAWRKLRHFVLERDGRRCRTCGATAKLTVHLDPALGGDHSLATSKDCITLCVRCHGLADGPRGASRAAVQV